MVRANRARRIYQYCDACGRAKRPFALRKGTNYPRAGRCDDCERKRLGKVRRDFVRYDVIECPEDSWGWYSELSGQEVAELLDDGCFFPGTVLERDGHRFVVSGGLECEQHLVVVE